MINLYRNIERSVYYWVVDLFSVTPFVKIEDSFPNKNLVLPTISIDYEELKLDVLELGNRDFKLINFNWKLDIFAETKTQRDDYAYLIIENLKNRIPVYDYNYGFPPSTPPKIGALLPSSVSYMPIAVFASLTDKMYWRGRLYFETEYEQI